MGSLRCASWYKQFHKHKRMKLQSLFCITQTHICTDLRVRIFQCLYLCFSLGSEHLRQYTRSPLEDSRLFGPSPWKILAAANEKTYLSNPAPGENLLSGNLVMETGCSNQRDATPATWSARPWREQHLYGDLTMIPPTMISTNPWISPLWQGT